MAVHRWRTCLVQRQDPNDPGMDRSPYYDIPRMEMKLCSSPCPPITFGVVVLGSQRILPHNMPHSPNTVGTTGMMLAPPAPSVDHLVMSKDAESITILL